MFRARGPRARRLQLPALVGGLVAGGLLVGALAPLVGNRLEVDADASGTPDVFAPGDGPVLDVEHLDCRAIRSAATTVPIAQRPRRGAWTMDHATGDQDPVARTASDVGVTADSITVGMMLLECKGCAAFGYAYPPTGPQIARGLRR